MIRGGIYLRTDPGTQPGNIRILVQNCTISNNKCFRNRYCGAGGIRIKLKSSYIKKNTTTSFKLIDSIFTENVGRTGAVLFKPSLTHAILTIRNVHFFGNKATSSGAGILVEKSNYNYWGSLENKLSFEINNN